MKYPQLVSTRAVNAISDWLVSRLEQLGVEAPQIYTRLLLSLLQSSVQINDPIEFNSLETFIGNRKGGSIKRYLQCDANTLKKLNAVQCLSEIVSSEQELTTIENLVEELWEKFKDIEKQLDYSYGDEAILLSHSGNPVQAVKSKANAKDQLVDLAHTNSTNNCNNSNNKNEKRTVDRRVICNSNIELETDPKKRYFNAFPALSKDMEDSFRVWRRNAKSLTWPADRGTTSSGSNMSTLLDTRTEGKSVKSADKINDLNTPKLDHLSNSSSHVVISAAGGLKRKTKRRKGQSISKGRTMPNVRKAAFNDNVINAFSTTGSVGVNRRANRHMSPTQWDTDFDGYWEMGRDLIKEFFAKQSDKNTNRCTSANGACFMNQTEDIAKVNDDSNGQILNKEKLSIEKSVSSPLMPQVDISFCCEDSIDDDDTYKSIAELTADNSLNNSHSSPRRLYQRLVLPENDGGIEPSTNDVHSDIVQFKSKFNSNLASLWQNTSDDENANYDETSLWSAPSNIPWPTVAPIKENLKNFWTNFYNHQFDLAKLPQEQDKQIGVPNELANMDDFLDMDNNACISLPYTVASLSNSSTKFNDTKDFQSMPYNMEVFDKANDDVLSVNKINKKPDGRRTPIGVFLQDSIWSENPNGGKITDTDESFYLKVWNSNKKLHNLDAIYEKKNNKTPNASKLNEASFQFSTYGNSKWSEGINAGPNALQQQQGGQLLINCRNKNEAFNQTNMGSMDCVDASVSTTTSCSSSAHTLSSSGIFSGQTPSLQSNLQNDNTKSLTEVYGINSPINNASEKGPKENEPFSTVSLLNHSRESSGFMEYSRIKSLSQTLTLDNIKQQQCNYQARFLRPKEQDCGNDNENLLGADRTHFQPIRNYENGYTFDICSAIEVINYKRSDSGYLYYESDKYLEYIREDNFIEDESSSVASASPLYAGSNCEAATAQKRQKERKDEKLVLKFKIMNHEIACQTDDEDTLNSIHASTQLQHPLYLIFSGAATDGIKIPTTGQACSDAIEALNKAVAAAAKAAAERDRIQLDTPWLRLNDAINTNRNAIDSSLIWTAVQASPREEIGVDEIDFCNESSCSFGNSMDKQWSMCPTDKRCQLNDSVCLGSRLDESHMRYSNVENNTIGMQQNNADIHSLWGMCAACNCEYKSAPANNLLRDELKLEADEIMSDLKNMQDLYIGCGSTGQGDGSDNDCNSNYYWGRHGYENDKVPKHLKHPHPIAIHGKRVDIEDSRDKKMHDWGNGLQLHQKETQQKVLQQVNKLIADLMRPEKANGTNVLADAAASAHRELGESLWPDDGDHNVWKQKFVSASQFEKENPIVSVRPSRNSPLCAEENNFLAQLTWEHNNLAEIWTKSTPPLTSKSRPPQLPPPSSPTVLLCSTPDACAKQRRAVNLTDNIQNDIDASSNISTSTYNIESHMEQYQKSELMKPSCESNEFCMSTGNCMYPTSGNDVPVATSSTTFKRIQQFLNSTGMANNVTTAKLKLTNRKRRHSASQNYAIFHNNGMGGGNALCAPNQNSNNSKNNNNNNNIKISDLNNYNLKPNASAKASTNTVNTIHSKSNSTAAAATPNFTDDIEMLEPGSEDSATYFLMKNGDNLLLPPPKQTIITCKYWTTIDPMMDTDIIECTEGTTFSCLVDKNDTILKHVTMSARPLTR